MNLGEFEESIENINELDKLIPNDEHVLKLMDELEILREKKSKSTKTFLKKGIFGSSDLYGDKETIVKSKTILPEINLKNKFIYLDMIIDNNHKNPYKVKFELYADNGLSLITDLIHDLFKKESLNFKENECSFIEQGNISFLNFIKIPFVFNSKLEDTIANNIRNYPIIEPGLLCIQYKENLSVNLSIEDITIPSSDLASRVVIGRCNYNKRFFDKIRDLYNEFNEYKESVNNDSNDDKEIKKKLPSIKVISYGTSINL